MYLIQAPVMPSQSGCFPGGKEFTEFSWHQEWKLPPGRTGREPQRSGCSRQTRSGPRVPSASSGPGRGPGCPACAAAEAQKGSPLVKVCHAFSKRKVSSLAARNLVEQHGQGTFSVQSKDSSACVCTCACVFMLCQNNI